MTMNPRSFTDKDSQARKEDDPSSQYKFIPKIPNNSSRYWSRYKNPRIVRVSHAFGGKDRHSKVCTIRGLKDRRIRLSVPTAIQLYDLQDRLGLSQPSKVVDWLLDVTKQDIDKLPPLPMIPMHPLDVPSHGFGFTPQPSLPHFISSNYVKDLGINAIKEGQLGDEQEGFGGFVSQISAQNLFPLNTSSNCSNNGNNSNSQLLPNLAYNSYFHPNLSLSQSGASSYSFLNQTEDERPHSSLLQPGSDLQYFCPSAMPIHSFPPMESELRQVNQQMNPLLPTTLSLISNSSVKPLAHQHVSSRTVFLLENDAKRWQDGSCSKP